MDTWIVTTEVNGGEYEIHCEIHCEIRCREIWWGGGRIVKADGVTIEFEESVLSVHKINIVMGEP